MDRDAERVDRPSEVAPPAPAPPTPERAELGAAAAMVDGRGPVSRAALMTLQQAAGNAAVSRLLSRQPAVAPPAPSGGTYNPLQADYDAARKERDEFVARGKKGPQAYNPSTSNKANYYGGFDVEYDPGSGVLLVTLKGAVLFVAGMTLDASGRAQAIEPSAQTAAAAAAINRLPKAKRAAEVAKWTWSSAGGPDGNDEQEFLDGFKSSVEGAWSQKHPFHCTKQYWEDLGAETQVSVAIGKVAAAGGKAADQHMLVNAHKVVKGFVGGSADVSRPTGAGGTAFDNVMNVTSEDVVPRKDDLLHSELSFQPGKGLLTPASVGTVWRLAKEMPNAKPGSTVPVAGLTVRVQGKDDRQRRDRFDAVRDHLKQAAGFDTSRATFEDGGEGDGGHITIGTGDAQTVVAHESGHMFGLDDEYTGSGAYQAGKKTEHTDFAAAAGHTGAMHAKSDSIMSEGKEVRPHHYVTFLDALKQVSGMAEWGYGPKQEVKPPSAAGDYPVPGTPGGGPQTGTAVA
jgi:hypothetical protein